jgi:hypothetical protein
MRSVRAVPVLLAVAAGLHFAVLPSHVKEGMWIGLFFAVTAVVQLAMAVAVQRGVGPLSRLVIAAANLGVVGVWLVSRTAGLALGGHDAAPEPIALLDSLSVVAELAAVAGLYLWSTASRPARRPRLAGLPALAFVALVAAVIGLPLAPPADAHEHTHAETFTPASSHHHTEG